MSDYLIDPHIHGVRAFLLWDDHGLSPYWGFVSAFEPEHEDREITFEAIGTEWEIVSSDLWHGGLAPPPSATFDGGLYEYKVKLEDRRTVDRDVTLTVRPGYPDAVHVDTGESIGGLPDDTPESIRIEVTSTNVGIEEIVPVAQAYFETIGVNPDYLAGEPHERSRMIRVEGYGRLDREVAEEKLVARGGLIQQLAQFSDRESLYGQHSWDHREATGKHEEARLGAGTWRMLLDRDAQRLGYAVKSYLADEIRSVATDPEDDPLADPKLELTYKKKWSDEAVPWSERDTIVDELRTTFWNVCSWAGIDPSAENSVWTTDDYFAAGGIDVEEPEIVSTPLDALESAREDAVVDQLAATSLSDEQRRVLIALFDQESNHYKALADRADVGTSTIYRLLDSLSGLLTSMRGQIRFEDGVVRDRVGGVVKRLRDMANWGRDRLQDAVEHASVFQDGALQQWVERHGIAVVQDGDQFEIDLGDGLTRDEARQILRQGGSKVRSTDQIDFTSFAKAIVRFRSPDGTQWQGLVWRSGDGFFSPLLPA